MPQTCPQCQSQATDDDAYCPSCGAALATSSTGAQAAPTASAPAPGGPPPGGPVSGGPASVGAAPAAAASSGSSIPAFKFDAARWSLADRIAGIATVVLFIALFLPFFTAPSAIVDGVNYGGGSVNGLWHGCTSC
jgi:zinc-ribbon domain